MTLILALKWVLDNREGIVMSSDSKATVGPVSYETRKVYPILLKVNEESVPLAIAGGAGDASLIKQSYRLCENVLKELAIKEWNKRTPTFEQFEEAIKHIESALIERFRELREQGLDLSFSMILGSVDHNGKAAIYLFDERGLAQPVHDNPGFAVIGTGFFTGGNLLLRLLGYEHDKSYMLDIGALSTFIIDVVSEIDPAVGPFIGESYYMRIEKGRVLLGPLTEEATKEYKEKIKLRKELIRRIWSILDIAGEEKFLEIISKFEKEITQERAAS